MPNLDEGQSEKRIASGAMRHIAEALRLVEKICDADVERKEGWSRLEGNGRRPAPQEDRIRKLERQVESLERQIKGD